MARFARRNFFLVFAIGWWIFASACEPPRPYRIPVPPSSNPIPRTPPAAPPAPSLPPPSAETTRKPLAQEGKIREQNLQDKPLPAPDSIKDAKESAPGPDSEESRLTPEPTLPPLPDDSSLLAKITPGVSPQRAASLRLTDEGRKLIDAGELARALSLLEKTIVIDSTNPYGYFYLAKAQYRLGRYQQSLNFLDVAQSRLGNEPFWLAEIQALRGDNYRGLGQLQRAEASYQQALRLNSGSSTATEGLLRLQADSSPAGK